MFALAAVIMVQSFAVNMVHIYQRDSDVRQTLTVIAENGGVLPNSYIGDSNLGFWRPFVEGYDGMETLYSTRYFSVELHGNIVTNIVTENITTVNEAEALEYASKACAGEPGFGFIDTFRYYYMVQPGRSIVVFVDFQREAAQSAALMTASIIVSLITMLVLLLCVYWLSKKAMKPVADSIEKQKQFITDASHELKTPLAIISANAEVLEMELDDTENEWLISIKNQTARLHQLVKNLVQLSKLNEMQDGRSVAFFNISKALIETAESFDGVAQIADKTYTYSAVPDVKYKGSEAEIRQLISILCDNAIKYTNEGGSIRLTLYKAGKNVIIEVMNTCEYIDPVTVSRLFDRFYRGDSSRARKDEKSGYGIGLSIAKAIVDRHKGKIRVFTGGTTSITFKITL